MHLTFNLTERKPETPEERTARLKAEEEASRRRAEAEAAKRRAEEEAAEKARREKAEYEKARSAWEAECRRVEGQRSSHVQSLQDARRKKLKNAAETVCADALAALDRKEEQLRAELSDTEKTLASLGFFKFGEKKAARGKIERLKADLAKAGADHAAAEAQKSDALSAIDSALAAEKDAMTRQAEDAFPMPAAPKKPESLLAEERAEEARRNAGMTPTQKENETRRQIIVEYLQDSEPMTISEMIEQIPGLENENNQHLSALCRALVLSGEIKKFTKQRRTYFCSPWYPC